MCLLHTSSLRIHQELKSLASKIKWIQTWAMLQSILLSRADSLVKCNFSFHTKLRNRKRNIMLIISFMNLHVQKKKLRCWEQLTSMQFLCQNMENLIRLKILNILSSPLKSFDPKSSQIEWNSSFNIICS